MKIVLFGVFEVFVVLHSMFQWFVLFDLRKVEELQRYGDQGGGIGDGGLFPLLSYLVIGLETIVQFIICVSMGFSSVSRVSPAGRMRFLVALLILAQLLLLLDRHRNLDV